MVLDTHGNVKLDTSNGEISQEKKCVKRLSREKLEKLVKRKVKKQLESESEVLKLQKTCKALEEEVKEWKERTENLARGFSKLDKLVKKSDQTDDPGESESLRPEGEERGLPSLPARVTPEESLPVPVLSLSRGPGGLQVYWTYPGDHRPVADYQLFHHRRGDTLWRRVGDIASIPLPIRVTLSQFKPGSTYSFIVRSRDSVGGQGAWSHPATIDL